MPEVYVVTAKLVEATATVNINGVTTVVKVDGPIEAVAIEDTLVKAKQVARADVNLNALTLLQPKITEATVGNQQLVKGRLSVDYSIWQKVNITNVEVRNHMLYTGISNSNYAGPPFASLGSE